MRIKQTPPIDTATPATVKCAHCGAPVLGQCALFVHLGDNPPHGRPNVNVISPGFQFCGPPCRDAWWSTPTEEPLIHDPDLLASPHPIMATVIHGDEHTKVQSVIIETDDGAAVAQNWGVYAGHHAFEHHDHLESWWRGDADVEPIPLANDPNAPSAPSAPIAGES